MPEAASDTEDGLWLDEDASLVEEYHALFNTEANPIDRAAPRSAIQDRLFERNRPSGICLSGGGNRGATFALGVMQAFAEAGHLAKFDYLSSVSGGACIAAWLTRGRFTDTGWDQRFAGDRPSTPGGPDPVRALRSRSNSQSPGNRSLFARLSVAWTHARAAAYVAFFWGLLLVAVAFIAHALVGFTTLLPEKIVALFPSVEMAAALGVPATTAIGVVFVAMLTFLFPNAGRKYQYCSSLGSAVLLAITIFWFVAVAFFVLIPLRMIAFLEAKEIQTIAPAVIALTGVATGLTGYWIRKGPSVHRSAKTVLGFLGMGTFDLLCLATLLILATIASLAAFFIDQAILDYYGLTFFMWELPKTEEFHFGLTHGAQRHLVAALVLLAAATIYSNWLGANRWSLQALLGARLKRTYLGSGRDREGSEDTIPLPEVAEAGKPGLFPIFNATLNRARYSRRDRSAQDQARTGFTATPLRTGCPELGYVRTAEYGGKDGLTLDKAMALSGAAGSPNMGYFGSTLAALTMAIFNLRLGWWLPNPLAASRTARLATPISWARHRWWELRAESEGEARRGFLRRDDAQIGLPRLLSEGLNAYSELSDWIYLSDGGHFDNFGLYELVRRQCRFILLVDATCDAAMHYAYLHRAIHRAQVDANVRIELPSSLPGQPGEGQRHRYTVGRIVYPDARIGHLIIVKPILLGTEPPALLAAAKDGDGDRPAFPHHSAGNAFLDEAQFECYRQLGILTGRAAMPELERFFAGEAFGVGFYPETSKGPEYPGPAGSPPPPDPPPPEVDKRDPPERPGALGSVAASLRDMSRGELIATALGTVAAVTVTVNAADRVGRQVGNTFYNTVTSIFDSEPDKQPPDTKDGPTGSPPPAGTNTPGPDDTTGSAPSPSASGKLGGTPPPPPPPPPPSPAPSVTSAELAQLSARIDALSRAIGGLVARDAETIRRIEALQASLGALSRQVEALQTSTTGTGTRIAAINRELADIRAQVRRLDPANNIRGQ